MCSTSANLLVGRGGERGDTLVLSNHGVRTRNFLCLVSPCLGGDSDLLTADDADVVHRLTTGTGETLTVLSSAVGLKRAATSTPSRPTTQVHGSATSDGAADSIGEVCLWLGL